MLTRIEFEGGNLNVSKRRLEEKNLSQNIFFSEATVDKGARFYTSPFRAEYVPSVMTAGEETFR